VEELLQSIVCHSNQGDLQPIAQIICYAGCTACCERHSDAASAGIFNGHMHALV